MTGPYIFETKFPCADTKTGSELFLSNLGDTLAPFLLKLAMSDMGPSSKAILHAILALSSLRLKKNGLADSYKASAISLLSRSLSAGSEQKVALQGIASSMLLYLYEVVNLCCFDVWKLIGLFLDISHI